MKQDKTKPIFGLKKVPNSILLKSALVENGKLKSYIDELEYNAKRDQERIKSQDALIEEYRQELSSQDTSGDMVAKIKSLKEQVTNLSKALQKRNREYDELMYRYASLQTPKTVNEIV